MNATKMRDDLDSIGGKISQAHSWGADKKKMLVGGLNKEYSTPQIIHRVASNYAPDFQLLGYDPDVIPDK